LLEAEKAAVEALSATVDHSDIRGSSLGPAVMVVIRRELPRTNVVGQTCGLPHSRREDPPVRVYPRPPLTLLQRFRLRTFPL